MKRIFILCMACMVLFAGVASAKVEKDKDETGLCIRSVIEKKDLGCIVELTKSVGGGEIFYNVHVFANSKFSDFVLADAPISIHIDKHPPFYLEHYKHRVVRGDDEYYSSISNAELSLDLIEKIKNGKNVSVWCKGKRLRPLYFAPEDFLDEWKQVINTVE